MKQKTPGVGFFGKVRIPTIGHASAIEHAKQISAKKNAQLHIGLSGTSHPLTPETKREHAEKLFSHPVMPASKHTSNIVSFLSHMSKMHDDFTLVAGQDRAGEYHRIISKYNGKPDSQGNVPFHFKKWRVHPVARTTTETKKAPTDMSRDELTKTVSASKLEAFANQGNYKHFAAYHPGMPVSHIKKIYNQIRMGSKLSESTIFESPLEMDGYDKKEHEIKNSHFSLKKIPKKRNRLQVKQNEDGFPTIHEYTHVSSTPTHHIFKHMQTHEFDEKEPMPKTEARDAKFLAIDRKTKKTHMYVRGYYTPSSKKFEINMLKGHPESTIKAHDFYHHLLLAGHVKDLHSDSTQSAGGRKVWKRLSHLPHVKLHTSDTKKPIKNDQDLDSHYTHDNDFDRITQRHRDKEGFLNFQSRSNDPEWKIHSQKSNRSFVAKTPLKENIAIGQTFSRDLMPQIKKENVKGFLQHLKNQGIQHKKKEVDSEDLKSTQSEFDREKIASLIHAKNKDRIFTSNDKHVLDGHHRWIANQKTGQKTKTFEVDLPILELMRQAKEYVGTVNENTEQHTFDSVIDSFTSFAGHHLGISKLPPIIRDNTISGSFGGYVPSQKVIRISTKNRHPMDALRTIAHELVHHKQNEDGKLSDPTEAGKTGSDIENEANAVAGQIMRHWAKANPGHFALKGLTENVAIFVVGVPCSGKDQIIKTLQEAPWVNPELDSWKDDRPDHALGDIDLKHYKKVSSAHGHDIYKKETESHAAKIKFTTYAAAKDGHPKVAVKMSTHGDGKSVVTGLQATKDNKLKAHDFYHHLITHHGETIHSDAEQSEGAKKVWKRLMKKPGLKFHVHDWSNGKVKPLHHIPSKNWEDSNTSLVASKLKESFQEVDIQALQKTTLSDRLIVSASADKLNNISEAICYLDDLGYHTSMIFVNVNNDTSKLRNEQRGQRGQRMLKEITRQVKYDLATENKIILEQLFGEDFALYDNTPELKSEPKDREWGTKSLTKIYKNMTPGQGKKKPKIRSSTNTDLSNDGIGATTSANSLGGLGTGYSVPIYEWMTNPRTIERFTNRYGKDAEYRIQQVAKMFEQNGLIKSAPKSLVNIRESYMTSKTKNNK